MFFTLHFSGSNGDEYDSSTRHHNLVNFHHNDLHPQLLAAGVPPYAKETFEFKHLATTLQHNGHNFPLQTHSNHHSNTNSTGGVGGPQNYSLSPNNSGDSTTSPAPLRSPTRTTTTPPTPLHVLQTAPPPGGEFTRHPPHLHSAVTNSLQPNMDQLFNSKMHAERFLSEMARLQEPICDLNISDSGVFAKVPLHRSTRYGPFAVKLCNEPTDRKLAWEVSEFICLLFSFMFYFS